MSRIVPQSMTNGWLNPAKVGPRRPVVRATVQRQMAYRHEYDTAWAQGGSLDGSQDRDKHRTGHFTSLIFGEDSPYREIPNILTMTWDRATGQDAATATLTLLNTEVTAIGEIADAASALDKAGFLSYNRGSAKANARWGYQRNGWADVLVPDMVIKTYEGYGINPLTTPPADPNLMQSGTWMIDKVTYNDAGSITIEMRDLGRVLLDEVVFPPAIPFAAYPLSWVRNHDEEVPARDAKGGHWQNRLRAYGSARSSNDLYIGAGLTNAPYANYVADNGNVEGHSDQHPIGDHDRSTDEGKAKDEHTLWRSTGQDAPDGFVWWEFEARDRMPIAAVRVRAAGGPFRVYISVHDGTKWVGTKDIPYEPGDGPGGIDIGADIPFVKSAIADRFFVQDYTLPRKYRAKRVRITFTHLRQREVGEHPFRAGLRELQLYTGDYDSLHFEKGTVTRTVGNYGDFTHIIKTVCAWAGWYWPAHSTGQDFIRVQGGGGSPATKDYVTFIAPDPAMPQGRVWGDFMKTGTGGKADLTVDLFDKKPLMDIINYVRDLTGFLFFIDETGGVVWRMPNIWSYGNYVSPQFFGDGRPGKRGAGQRDTDIVTLDETTTLLAYSSSLDSKNIRERVFIANVFGGIGTVVRGFNPYPIGLTRVAGWTDQHFDTKRETRIMAQLVATQQKFSYKTGTASTPGYPKIQVDDQIQIIERVTGETGYHYVSGIHSEINMAEGTWTYDLTTHWLGEDAGNFVVKPEQLDNATQQYLAAVGGGAPDAEDKDS